jgi:hypothetical protein
MKRHRSYVPPPPPSIESSFARSVSLVLSLAALALLMSCGKTISNVPNVPPCAGEGCADPTTGATETANPNDTTGDQSSAPNDDDDSGTETRACTANDCVDGDGFCDVGFCDTCVRDDDCSDAPAPPAPPGDDSPPVDDGGSVEPPAGDLPECQEDECVDGDGFCDVDFCSTCAVDADCSSSDPNDPSDPTGPAECQGDDDCPCLANECIEGDGFCDEDWCDCDDDPDCNDDANEHCIDDDDCCLPNECIAGDGFCDEDFCQGCEVDPDCD